MNMLLPSSSCETTTLTTCRILLHYDNIDSFWFPIFWQNLVKFPQLWISSSSSSSFRQASFRIRLFRSQICSSSLPPLARQRPWQRHVFCFTMITLVHRSDFPYSVRIWSIFLDYESLHLPLACRFLTGVPRRQRQRGRTPDKLWEQYFASLVHHFQWPVPVFFTRPSFYFCSSSL